MFLLSIRICINRVRQLSFMFLVSIRICMNRLRQFPLCVFQRFLCALFFHKVEMSENSQVGRQFRTKFYIQNCMQSRHTVVEKVLVFTYDNI